MSLGNLTEVSAFNDTSVILHFTFPTQLKFAGGIRIMTQNGLP